MNPIDFEESNHTFEKPKGELEEDCGDLPVHACVSPLPSGKLSTILISCWEPSDEELEEINKTRRIWCFHYGGTLQPHALFGTNPFSG